MTDLLGAIRTVSKRIDESEVRGIQVDGRIGRATPEHGVGLPADVDAIGIPYLLIAVYGVDARSEARWIKINDGVGGAAPQQGMGHSEADKPNASLAQTVGVGGSRTLETGRVEINRRSGVP